MRCGRCGLRGYGDGGGRFRDRHDRNTRGKSFDVGVFDGDVDDLIAKYLQRYGELEDLTMSEGGDKFGEGTWHSFRHGLEEQAAGLSGEVVEILRCGAVEAH